MPQAIRYNLPPHGPFFLTRRRVKSKDPRAAGIKRIRTDRPGRRQKREQTLAGRKPLRIGLIGQGFMGRAHSNAWSQVNKFFNLPLQVELHAVCAKNRKALSAFAANWGWRSSQTDWKKLCNSPEIDLVDVGTPNYLHAPMAVEAMRAGKHVACEKPLAGTLDDAREMALAAGRSGVKTFVWYNYRRCPAIALAHQLVKAGKIGRIRHVRAAYLQSWAGPDVPLAWRFDKKLAGSGAHGDLNAHIIDMARFITGREIVEIAGAIEETFVKRRNRMVGSAAGGIAEGLRRSRSKGRVTVDDAVLFLARFAGGAVATFEATRQATGHQNRHGIEIDGTCGSLRFDFQRMTELEYYDAATDPALRGWTTIDCSHAGSHPYVEAWWPDAHPIGYEHTFTNMAADMLRVLAGTRPVVPIPDFQDAYQTQRVLEAVLISAAQKRSVNLSEVT